eukprot:g2131.t1
MELLNKDLKISQSNQSLFYATIMVPWYFKPFYGWIVGDQSHRRATYDRLRRYLVAASAGSSVAYVLTAVAVQSSTGLYLATILRSLSNAFSELCLGVALVSIAESDSRESAGMMQGAASGARAAGSLAAYILAVPLYPCHSSNGEGILSARTVIGMNGTICVLTAICAAFLPYALMGSGSKKNRNDVESVKVVPSSPSREDEVIERKGPRTVVASSLVVLVMTLAAGFGIFWVKEEQQHGSLRANTPPALWYASIAFSGLLLLSSLAWTLLQYAATFSGSANCDESEEFSDRVVVVESQSSSWRTVVARRSRIGIEWRQLSPALFLFAYNATPSAETQWSNLTYSMFDGKICYYQYLSIISMAASTLGSVLYARVCSKRRVHLIIVAATLLSVCAGLLRLPLAIEWNKFGDDEECGTSAGALFGWMRRRTFANNCSDVAFEYLAVASTVMGIFSQCATIPLIVLAIERCPLSKAGVWYGMFLASIDFGSSVSGWITAPIVEALHIAFSDYDGLSTLIIIESVSKLSVLLLVPLLACSGTLFAPCSVPVRSVRAADDDSSSDIHRRRIASDAKECGDDEGALEIIIRGVAGDRRTTAVLMDPLLPA